MGRQQDEVGHEFFLQGHPILSTCTESHVPALAFLCTFLIEQNAALTAVCNIVQGHPVISTCTESHVPALAFLCTY